MKRKLNDVVRGLYSSVDQQEYINEILSEAQRECECKKEQDKLNGLQKLPILYLLGVDVKQFGFATLECLSSADQKIKRCGYFVSSFTFGRGETRTLSTNAYIRDIRHKDCEVRHMALGSLASCITPQKEQVYALFPVLFEQLRDQSSGKIDIRLMQKLIATILHLLIASQKNGIENLQEYVSIFVDLLITIQQNDKTAALRANIAFMQLWARTGIELGVNLGFASVMKLVPIYADLLQNQTSPWVTTSIISFLGRIAAYDQRIAYKLSNQVGYFLQNTESKSLLMEIAKQVVGGFSTNQDLISLATTRVSKYVVRASHHHSDSNLRALALKNLASLERVSPGSLMRVDQLPQELLKSLSDTDFNHRILVLDVISCLATHQYVDNIITTLLTNLQNTKTYSQGSSLQSLHKQSSEDIKIFRQTIVRIVIELITNPDLIQNIPVQRVLGVLSTLIIEYPNESSNVFCYQVMKLMANQNISPEWKEIFVLLASIILNDENIYQYAMLPGSEKNNVKNQLSLYEGPVQCNQRINTITEQIVYTQINQLQYTSNYQLLHGNGTPGSKSVDKLFSQNLSGIDFYKEFIKLSEFEINALKFKQSQIWLTDGSELVSEQLADVILSVNNIIQTQAYILGSQFIYQQGGDNSINVYNAVKTLLTPCIKYTNQNNYTLPLQTINLLIFMTTKMFITSLIVMSESELFAQEEIAEQFVTKQYSSEFAIMKELTIEEAKELKKKKEQDLTQYNPFGTEDENGEEEIEKEVLQATQTLINIYVMSYVYIIETLQKLASVQDIMETCDQCYKLLCISYKSLSKLVDGIENNTQLKEDLKTSLDSLDIQIDKELEDVSPKEMAEQLISVQVQSNFSQYLRVEKPNFSFEDSTVFDLNNTNQTVLSEYDMSNYHPEEWDHLYKPEHKSLQKQPSMQNTNIQQDQQNIFRQPNPITEQTNEIQPTNNSIQSPASIVDNNKNAMDMLFGQPKQENNIYIINSLNKNNQKQIQLNKYIQNIQYKKQIQPEVAQFDQPVQEEPQKPQDKNEIVENDTKQEKHKSKKRKHKHKHHKKEDDEPQEKENKSDGEQ